MQRFKDSEWIGSGDRGGGGGIRMWRRGRVRMENINGVSGRGVSLKTSTFLLLLKCTVFWNKQLGGTAVNSRKRSRIGNSMNGRILHTPIHYRSSICAKQTVNASTTGKEI